MPILTSLTLREHGAQWLPGAVVRDLDSLRMAVASLPKDQAGIRLRGVTALEPFIEPNGSIGIIAAAFLGSESRAVRAILFDKTEATNWSLAWHQDRTICVKRRIDVEGFEPWTIKDGLQHVAPPFDILSRMVTMRVHLDDVPETNAPLLIAPGSHTEGLVRIDAVPAVVQRCGVQTCIAAAGDVWIYATPILHASAAATAPAHRKVLQIDFAAEDLPGGLEWAGTN
jgi:hypothetical protein